jgi:hypothetical protein
MFIDLILVSVQKKCTFLLSSTLWLQFTTDLAACYLTSDCVITKGLFLAKLSLGVVWFFILIVTKYLTIQILMPYVCNKY